MQPQHAIAAVTHSDPFPYYRALRLARPIFFDEAIGLWVATSHAVISEAFAHAQLRVRPPAEPVPRALVGTTAGDVFAQLVRMTDGSFHSQHKPVMEQTARNWTLTRVANAADQAARDLRPRMRPNQFLATLPVQTMARLQAVPEERLDATCEEIARFARGIVPGASPQDITAADAAARSLMAQGAELGLPPVQAASRIAFMQQSLDATWALMASTALRLRSDPNLAIAGDQSQDAMRRCVAEVERHESPTQNTRRFAAQALELAGCAIAEGQGILLVLAAANRDEALNAQPDQFNPQRTDRRTMGFGAGRHGCPGSAIAIEIAVAGIRFLRQTGQFDDYFGPQVGFRPLGNIRCPLFDN